MVVGMTTEMAVKVEQTGCSKYPVVVGGIGDGVVVMGQTGLGIAEAGAESARY